MCALLSMAVYDTAENKRSEYTERTLYSLLETVDFKKHRLFISDNGSCSETFKIYDEFIGAFHCKFDIGNLQIIQNGKNLGTAEAVNMGWKFRRPGEHCIKMDNDVVINYNGWVDEMEQAIERDPNIGQVGLKRVDCWETPWNPTLDFRSELMMLPHEAGQRWIIVEKVHHVIGTCVMHSSNLLDQVGYLRQKSEYGYDDVIMSHRSRIAGYYNCFLPHINIEHIDTGETEYQKWKEKHSGEQTQAVIDLVHRMYNKEESIHYNPFE